MSARPFRIVDTSVVVVAVDRQIEQAGYRLFPAIGDAGVVIDQHGGRINRFQHLFAAHIRRDLCGHRASGKINKDFETAQQLIEDLLMNNKLLIQAAEASTRIQGQR